MLFTNISLYMCPLTDDGKHHTEKNSNETNVFIYLFLLTLLGEKVTKNCCILIITFVSRCFLVYLPLSVITLEPQNPDNGTSYHKASDENKVTFLYC